MAEQIKADVERFAAVASTWESIASDILAAQGAASLCVGQGEAFGAILGASSIDEECETFAKQISESLEVGATSAHRIAGALLNAARDFHATDASVSADYHEMARRLG